MKSTVAACKLYVSKLHHKGKAFFLRPKVVAPANGPWYDNMVLGVKSLEKMMKKISLDAKLSYSYTNHSIRSTCITILDQAGVEARHIMSVSGHKSESSLRTYSRTSNEKRKQMSALLSEHTSGFPAKRSRNEPTSSISPSPEAGPSRDRHPVFVRNFDLASVIPESPVKPMAPSILSSEDTIDTELQKNMYEQFFRQFASFASVCSGTGRNVYNNCTFNNVLKSDKRKRVIIESDSESSQEF